MEKKEISNGIIWLMVGTAIFYDFFQFIISLIPIVGLIFAYIVSIFAFLTFYIWFKIYGRSFLSPKRALAMGAGVIIEMIPLLNALPGWTVAVLLLIGIEKAEKISKIIPGGTIVTKVLGTVGGVWS